MAVEIISRSICTFFKENNILLTFQNLQEVDKISKMVASIGLLEVKILIFELLELVILHPILIKFVTGCTV